MTKKTILGQGAWYLVYGAGERTYIATTFTFDDANQLVSSTVDGVTTRYTYDAAGRLVKEGNKTYRYGYLDKVMSVSDGKQKLTYDYHADGQIASANYGNGKTEEFLWDGLALVKRGTISYVNEPHPGGGAPVASSNGGVMFNDILGTTLGVENAGGYASSSMTAFGDTVNCQLPTSNFFTGKPHVDGLGHAFLLRNYRADLGKWLTTDPLGYPDGWNQMAYCRNGVVDCLDFLGAAMVQFMFLDINSNHYINSASGLVVSNRSVIGGGGDAGGYFYSAVNDAYFYSDTNVLIVVIDLALFVLSALKRSSEFEAGQVSRYYPHMGATGDSGGDNSVYEVICAHELGHANCFFSKIIPDLSFTLSTGADAYKNNPSFLQSYVRQQFLYVTGLYTQQSGLYANEAVYSWFAGNSEWKELNVDRTGWSSWVKKGGAE